MTEKILFNSTWRIVCKAPAFTKTPGVYYGPTLKGKSNTRRIMHRVKNLDLAVMHRAGHLGFITINWGTAV